MTKFFVPASDCLWLSPLVHPLTPPLLSIRLCAGAGAGDSGDWPIATPSEVFLTPCKA